MGTFYEDQKRKYSLVEIWEYHKYEEEEHLFLSSSSQVCRIMKNKNITDLYFVMFYSDLWRINNMGHKFIKINPPLKKREK